MSITPLGDRVIVTAGESEEVTASGIVLPDTAKEKPQRGTVVAVGAGRWVEGERIAPDVEVGDVVIYSKYGGTELNIDGDDVIVLSEHDILAKLDEFGLGAFGSSPDEFRKFLAVERAKWAAVVKASGAGDN